MAWRTAPLRQALLQARIRAPSSPRVHVVMSVDSYICSSSFAHTSKSSSRSSTRFVPKYQVWCVVSLEGFKVSILKLFVGGEHRAPLSPGPAGLRSRCRHERGRRGRSAQSRSHRVDDRAVNAARSIRALRPFVWVDRETLRADIQRFFVRSRLPRCAASTSAKSSSQRWSPGWSPNARSSVSRRRSRRSTMAACSTSPCRLRMTRLLPSLPV